MKFIRFVVILSIMKNVVQNGTKHQQQAQHKRRHCPLIIYQARRMFVILFFELVSDSHNLLLAAVKEIRLSDEST